MDILIYIVRFLYRIRRWLIIVPLVVTVAVILKTRSMGRTYDVSTTIYTGIASGFNIESEASTRMDWNTVNNAMDNLINIIYAQTTLQKVSMRLYAQHMMYGDLNKDNNYITAKNFRAIYNRTPKEVRALIDKKSEQKTLENLKNYEKASPKNFVYGLFNWKHPHYSYEALRKIEVKRMSNSDMLDIKYKANDPGIAYNTLLLLNEEFINQYTELRFGETNNVIAYFEAELRKTGTKLRMSEDSLTHYNVEKRVINYDEQTKHVAALNRDHELRYEEILLRYNSSQALIAELEQRIDDQIKALKNNSLFMNKLNNISNLSRRITNLETMPNDSLVKQNKDLGMYKNQLKNAENEFSAFAESYSQGKYTKEGVSSTDVVQQWLTEIINYTKAKAELDVMAMRRQELDAQYSYYSPIGSTIKRKEREIGFTEQTYLNFLHSLNAALMKQKNLQMTSATLKILNPPIFPISAMPTNRKVIVLAAFIASIVLVIGFFLFLELLDRTLRDKMRTERLTKGKVLGAFPATGLYQFRGYAKECSRIANQYMGNAIMHYFTPGKKPYLVNMISMSKEEGKSFLSEQLSEYWKSIGLTVKILDWDEYLTEESKSYMLAQSIEELSNDTNYDVIIIEHPAMQDNSIPTKLLQDASINLLVARADKVWKDTDQLLMNRLNSQVGDAPLFIYLNKAQRFVIESFVGLLPPYTPLRKFIYRIYQMGLTSK